MRGYTVIVHDTEEDETGYWAEVEELPGCYASGETLDELEVDVRQAIEFYIGIMKDSGDAFDPGADCADASVRRWQLAVDVDAIAALTE